MLYLAAGLIVICFAMIGFVEILRNLIFRICKPKGEHSVMIIIPKNSNSEDIEYTLRSCVARAKWMGKTRPDAIVCLDTGLDEDALRICKSVCNDYEFMHLLKTEELYNNLVKSRDNNKTGCEKNENVI